MCIVTTFFFAPPSDRGWGLSLKMFAEEALRKWPEGSTYFKELTPGDHCVSFMLSEPRIDLLFSEDESLNCQRQSPEEAADVLVWFLGLLPEDALIKFNSMAALELDSDRYGARDWWLDRHADVFQIAETLRGHLADLGL